MSENTSLFDYLGTEITELDQYQDFMQGVSAHVDAIEQQHPDSHVTKFETRATAHQICASQEMNTILYDIALSLRVLSGRNDK